jgi:hypothetical protein
MSECLGFRLQFRVFVLGQMPWLFQQKASPQSEPQPLTANKNPPRNARDFSSGADVSRTRDLIIANDALYQLSYRPDRSQLYASNPLAESHWVAWTGSTPEGTDWSIRVIHPGSCAVRCPRSRPAGKRLWFEGITRFPQQLIANTISR